MFLSIVLIVGRLYGVGERERIFSGSGLIRKTFFGFHAFEFQVLFRNTSRRHQGQRNAQMTRVHCLKRYGVRHFRKQTRYYHSYSVHNKDSRDLGLLLKTNCPQVHRCGRFSLLFVLSSITSKQIAVFRAVSSAIQLFAVVYSAKTVVGSTNENSR